MTFTIYFARIYKIMFMLLATDELSMDVGSIAQLLIFLQEVTETFQISEEYSATVSLKDET